MYIPGTATCRYRGRVGTGLSVLWVAHYPLQCDKYQMLYIQLYAVLMMGGGTTRNM
jgi:hypothetical protein